MAFRFIPGRPSATDPEYYKRDEYWLDTSKPAGSFVDEAVVTVLVSTDEHAQAVIREALKRNIRVRAEKYSPEKEKELDEFLKRCAAK
ncbi:MAG: hypothetical protein AAB964_02765 [Patescibacteria group bacterium]